MHYLFSVPSTRALNGSASHLWKLGRWCSQVPREKQRTHPGSTAAAGRRTLRVFASHYTDSTRMFSHARTNCWWGCPAEKQAIKTQASSSFSPTSVRPPHKQTGWWLRLVSFLAARTPWPQVAPFSARPRSWRRDLPPRRRTHASRTHWHKENTRTICGGVGVINQSCVFLN